MSVKLKMSVEMEQILKTLRKIDAEEKQLMKQEQKNQEIELKEAICNNIKENIANSPSMNLVSEEVLEDGSVVITVNV